MTTQVVERAGILMRVDYVITNDEMQFNDVRVLDADYRPCGPNLVPLLDPMLVLHEGAPFGSKSAKAERFLSTVLTEIQQ